MSLREKMVAKRFQLAKVRKYRSYSTFIFQMFTYIWKLYLCFKYGGGIHGLIAVRHVNKVYKEEIEFAKETAQKWTLQLLITRTAIKEAVSILYSNIIIHARLNVNHHFLPFDWTSLRSFHVTGKKYLAGFLKWSSFPYIGSLCCP